MKAAKNSPQLEAVFMSVNFFKLTALGCQRSHRYRDLAKNDVEFVSCRKTGTARFRKVHASLMKLFALTEGREMDKIGKNCFSSERRSLVDRDQEAMIARDTLERYSGSKIELFRSYLLLTNFGRYVDYYAKSRGVPVYEGAMFKVAHCPEEDISILDLKIGSPAAALVADVCAFLPFKSALLLGMCGGLRRHYRIGDYLVPVASIRGDGTSDFYFPPEVPSLANFLVQRAATAVLEDKSINYHIGITHTTNKRMWEFNEQFKDRLKANRAQAIEMECATLFLASYRHKLPLGALLLISDLPLDRAKTKESSEVVFEKHTKEHVELGVLILNKTREMLKAHVKGASRGYEGKAADVTA